MIADSNNEVKYMTEPKVSIITAVYNTPLKYLKECFKSVQNQTYRNIELIIIDDGSEKKVSDLCDSFCKSAGKSFPVKVIHNENHGVSFSRNCGLDNATGDYVIFLDSDDAIDNDYIRLLLETADFLKCKMVVCDYSKTGLENSGTHADVSDISVLYRGREIWENLNTSYIWRTLYSADILKGIRFDEKLKCCEDIKFFDKVIKKSGEMGYLPLKLYYYRQVSGSITHKFSKEVCKDAIKVYEKIYLTNKAVTECPEVYSEILSCYTRWIVRYVIAAGNNGDFAEFTAAKKMCVRKTKGHILPIRDKKIKLMAAFSRLPACMYYICIKAYDALRRSKL